MRMRRYSMFPFACMPLVLWGVVRLVVSSLADVRVLTIDSCVAYLPNGIRVDSQTHSIQASLLGTLEDFKVPHVNHLASAGNARGRCLVINGCYLVDPASSHMLVSKIKPCMCNLFDGIYYSDNLSNSRANTCNKPRLLEGMHLLDKRSTQTLPVALMIHDNLLDRTTLVPLVVGPWVGSIGPPPVCIDRLVPSAGNALLYLTSRVVPLDSDPIVLAFGIGVMINRDSRGHLYFIVRERKLGARRRSDTVLVSTINDADQGSTDVAFRTSLAPYEKSKSLGSRGSMVARLKHKGIDGRAPPRVEPAA
ncbi:hypothetical protein GmHk_13G036364 [Glycine max]|nr:hypothetical protein GmHk_13G036364 [Glycine max]